MIIVYALQEAPKSYGKSIFLAGPTPRDKDVPSWRPEAIRLLEELGFDGVVFVPEAGDSTWKRDYTDQVEWEEKYLNSADITLFWVPREMQTMPALTTNVEWGMWYDSGKAVLGHPEGAQHVRYLSYYGQKEAAPCETDLREALRRAVEIIGDGAVRTGSETLVPLILWKTASFQGWYRRTVSDAGNRLDGFRVKVICRAGPQKKFVFLWVAHVNIWVEAEGRNKSNEIILARPDICSLVLFRRGVTLLDTEVVLVREFRSTVNNSKGFVLELPGGSSWKSGQEPSVVMCDECREETGIEISPERAHIVGDRQLLATFSVHRALVGAVELTEAEMRDARLRVGSVRAESHETGERVYLEVKTIRDLLGISGQQMDWSNLGMIMAAIQG
ncbi:MAG: nucleoside 2-deoxyribosyltransferase domain-containing protein [Candidatus Paceibacterota bacterium]|jgi:8-oxo-dGTP pyrophosphatase MutT (NUDIX family)